MPAFDFTDRIAQYDAEEGDNQELVDGSGNGNNLLDSNSVPGGRTGIIGDARGIIRSGASNAHLRAAYVASGPWDVRGLTSITMAGWFKVLNTEQQHVFLLDDPAGTNGARQAFNMILRETNTGGNAAPWLYMHDGSASRFVGGVSLKVEDTLASISIGVWYFFAGGYDAIRNKLFGFWGVQAGESYYKEVDGLVAGFGYAGTGSEAMIGKFNGEPGDADMHVDHLLWWNGRALSESNLAIVWNDHVGIDFNALSGVTGDSSALWYWKRKRGLILP